jgi:diguanylate cyclase (GGDEF)-like protein
MLQGDATKALDYFERARAAFAERGTRREKLIALANVGRALEELGELPRALEKHERCLRAVREANDTKYLTPTLTKYGVALGKLGRTEEAFASFREALLHLDAGQGSFRDETIHAMASLHLKVGEPEKAESLYREAVSEARARGGRQAEASACLGLTRALEGLGRWREAFECLRRFHELDVELTRQLYSGRAQALLLHGELEHANRERELLRDNNRRLGSAFDELRALHEALEDRTRELQRLTLEDPLTKLSNRRQLENRLGEEASRLARYGGRPFSVVMCDIDDFKAINDRHSHVVGDEILVQFSKILRGNTRETDVVARIGGEEFVLLLPETSAGGALRVAEKIRSAVETFPWSEVHPATELTVSAGVATVSAGEDAAALLKRADEHLYRAKRMGKNQVCSDDEQVPQAGRPS